MALLLGTVRAGLVVARRKRSLADAQLRTLFDLIPAMIWFKDTTNHHVRVNKRVADAVGLRVSDIEGRHCAETYPDHAARYYTEDLEIMASGQPRIGVIESLPARDGGPRWIRTDKVPYFDAGGHSAGILVISHDVTEQKQMSDALQEERNRLALVAATAPTAIVSFRQTPDGDRSFTYASPRVFDIYGVTPEELIADANSALSRWHPDDLIVLGVRIEASSRTMTEWHQEFRVRHPHRGEIWVEGRSQPVADPDGMTWHGVLTDITERKRADRAVADRLEMEARLSTLAATAPGAIFTFQQPKAGRNRFLYLSQRIEEITGFPADLLLADAGTALNRVQPDDRMAVERSLLEAGQTSSMWTMAFRYQHPDKGPVWLEGRATPCREADGGFLWQGFLIDITDRKQLEEQFRQAQKMEAIGQLAGGVAHDFNNILMVIQGNASLLQNDTNDPKQRRFLHEIIEASNRAAGLTRQLLLFGRKQVLRPVDLDLNAVVANMTKMLQRILGEDITLEAHFAPALPRIFADPGMIEQVVLNLAVNSRDAMPHGGTLSVSTGMCEDAPQGTIESTTDAPWVYLRVNDTGCGIPAEVLPHIFEPFFTTKEVGRGTGLGLATVYGVVKQHGGWVSVDGIEPHGTSFQIGFPAAVGALLRPSDAPAVSAVPRGAETILVVEDEPAVCEMVAALLQHWGYKVLTAESGRAALDVWRVHGPTIDLLLTDIVMPDGLSGRALAEQLREDRGDLKVIYTSGYSEDVARGGLTLVEGVDFLPKPYALRHLAEIVRRRLDRPA